MDARPGPVDRAIGEARPNRSEGDIAKCCAEMGLVQRNAAEPPLPEMPGPLEPGMDDTGIAAMHSRERAADPIGIVRHQDQVHMVGHQDPGPYLHRRGAGVLQQQIAIERVVILGEESLRAAVATLRDMVRVARENGAGEAGHPRRAMPTPPAYQLSALSP